MIKIRILLWFVCCNCSLQKGEEFFLKKSLKKIKLLSRRDLRIDMKHVDMCGCDVCVINYCQLKFPGVLQVFQ